MIPRVDARDTRRLRYFLIVLILGRAVVAGILPLSFDEAYYWLWSKHLAAGYYDHPPLIAYVIRAGTMLFGDSEFAVRFVPLLLSIAATWAVWRAAAILLGSEHLGGLSALLYNLTLMVTVQALVATPDAPAMAASSFFLLALITLAVSRRGHWWLAVGVAGGFALLSKFTAFFLGAGVFLWLVAVPDERRWFKSVWLYLGAALALFMFAPVVFWNAGHGWISFTQQFGRVGAGSFTMRYLGEFIAAQIALATPFVLVLSIAGLSRISVSRDHLRTPMVLLTALTAPALVYFLWHSFFDRVQGNWPSFLYPFLAIAAAAAWNWSAQGWGGRLLRLSRTAAVPVAVVFTLGTYVHSLWGITPLERDPIVRLLAVGYGPLAREIEHLRATSGANAILTTSYAQTGWLSFYLPAQATVYQANDRERWPPESWPRPEAAAGPFLYVSETWRDHAQLLEAQYGEAVLLATLPRYWQGRIVEEYAVYRIRPLPETNAD